MELYDASTRRVTGKQPPYVEDRKVSQPLQHDELPQLLQGDLGAVGDSDDVWGEARKADQGEDVMSLGYSPDEMPQDQLHEGDEHGSEKEMPALLRAVWAGGGVQSHFNGNSKNFNRTFAFHNDLCSIVEDTLGVWELRPVATW